MVDIPGDSGDWAAIIERLGGAVSLRQSAREHGAFTRPRGVRDAIDVLRLCMMYGPGGLSLRMLAATAAEAGIADVSDVAILNRIRGAADWLEALCGQQFSRIHPAASDTPGPGATRAVRIVDSSLIDGPGRVKWRLHACFDPVGQRLTAAAFTPAKTGERLDLLGVDPSDIVLADRGYPQPDGLRNTIDKQADPLVRVTWNSVTLSDGDAQPLDWMALCKQATRQGGLDLPVQLRKARGTFAPVAMRLIFVPKNAEAAKRAVAKARHKSRAGSRKQIDPRTIACAHHLILLTTLPEETCSPAQAGELYRIRWQVEMLFKRMKSLMRIGKLPAQDPHLVRAWLNAHLLCALLTEDIVNQDDAFPP
jgi:hypothetical protein